MFLEKSEMNTVSVPYVLEYLTETEGKFESIIKESIAIMSGFLSRRFDTEAVFNKTGEARNIPILKHLKAIVIHEMYTSIGRDEPNTVVSNRYEDAMRWLEKVNTGEFKIDLPLKEPKAQTHLGLMVTKSKPRYRSSF
jgi:phage gp36-like protein